MITRTTRAAAGRPRSASPPAAWRARPGAEAGRRVSPPGLLRHWFPPRISGASLSWGATGWLGTVSGVLFLLTVLSGLPLMLLYAPSVERAYHSVKDIEHVAAFGWWLRAVHWVAAHLMVAAVLLHLARVFVTGAYKNGSGPGQRRQWNWVIGVAMLLVTLCVSFTGYLLPWDQRAFWAVTVGTSILSSAPAAGPLLRAWLIGGPVIGQAALSRFYALHVVVLPAILVVLLAYHMWRVLKDGGLAAADRERDNGAQPRHGRPASDLVLRLAAVTMATFAAVNLAALALRAPLDEPANPFATPNPAKAPWYFLWLQELVTDLTIRAGPVSVNGAIVGGLVVPGVLLALLTAWPWLDRSGPDTAGRWFPAARRGQNAVFVAAVLAILALTSVGLWLRGPSWGFYWPWDVRPGQPTRF
ncbi:MAG TPA: cytochrome b N-terminal domain-containing protein [Vicinamibacterales bacterium]|nr:cytochrome b N-terminal domain-containing protein [Vicinamibacterales bacterium]HPW22206.1 cytochrome b N-terminal domain-containing protein [Vicinamibacterales bacterium]